MGLASALSTALTGLTAAETTIDVVGNNLANSNTVGFKASQASFATQFLQTRSLGSGPTAGSGGTNPRQIGLGTMVADITPNFSQGTIEISSNPTDLAIQGDGFFIVQGRANDHLYTRNGVLKMNSQSELVTSTGNRLLGYGVDNQFQIDASSLRPITIPLGAKSVAKATQNVFLEGTLSPQGALADRAKDIQSVILSDGRYTYPEHGISAAMAANVGVAFTSAVPSVPVAPDPLGTIAQGEYYYKMVYADGPKSDAVNGTEGAASAVSGMVDVVADSSIVTISGWTTDSSYSHVRFYRTGPDPVDPATATYYYVGEKAMNAATPFVDNTAHAGTLPQLNTDGIGSTSQYQYYVTFFSTTTSQESQPVLIQSPVNVDSDKRLHLYDLPTLPGVYTGQYDSTRIYRNLSTDNQSYYRIATIPSVDGSATYTDKTTDAAILADPVLHEAIKLDGASISTSTLLKDLRRREGSSYPPIFDFTTTATLQFTGTKGGRSLGTKEFAMTTTSTVQDLINFIQNAMGIQTDSHDPNHPMPVDANSGLPPGGQVVYDPVSRTSTILFVGNNGTDNAVNIGLSSMRLVTATGTTSVTLPFNSVHEAAGVSAVADFMVYDSLGIPVSVRVTAVLQSRSSGETVYRWFADSPDNQNGTSPAIEVGTGLVTFDREGNYTTCYGNTLTIYRDQVAAASPLVSTLDFSQISGLAVQISTLAVSRQDGSAPGVLTSFIVGEDGRVRGVFSNGITRELGQIRLARFGNPAGLEQRGQNLFSGGVNSGLPVEGNPNEQGIGSIIAGAQELSNTDIGGNLIDLILASTMYRANTRVITTAQQMLDELLALRR